MPQSASFSNEKDSAQGLLQGLDDGDGDKQKSCYAKYRQGGKRPVEETVYVKGGVDVILQHDSPKAEGDETCTNGIKTTFLYIIQHRNNRRQDNSQRADHGKGKGHKPAAPGLIVNEEQKYKGKCEGYGGKNHRIRPLKPQGHDEGGIENENTTEGIARPADIRVIIKLKDDRNYEKDEEYCREDNQKATAVKFLGFKGYFGIGGLILNLNIGMINPCLADRTGGLPFR